MLDDGADAFEGDRLAGAPRSQGSLFASYGTLLGDAWTVTVYAAKLLDEYAVTSVRRTLARIGRTADGFTSRRYFANVLTPRGQVSGSATRSAKSHRTRQEGSRWASPPSPTRTALTWGRGQPQRRPST